MLDFVTSKTQQPIDSGGYICPPDPLLQRSTTGFSPLPQIILDPPLYRAGWNGPAAPVLVGPIFHKVNWNKIPFLQIVNAKQKF